MNSLTLPTNWNNIPVEIKMKIIKYLEMKSRLALRLGSIDDFKLVNSVPYRKIHHLVLEDNENGFHIVLKENYYSSDEYQFEKFEEFQEKVLKVLENVDYIKSLVITMKNAVENMKLVMHGSPKIKVEELTLNSCRPEECLKQVDRSVLKKLDFQSNQDIEASAQLYELPQFNSVDELHIIKLNIQDDQLMKLKPKKITLEFTRRLTSAGICNFIRRRTFDQNFEGLILLWLDENLCDEIINTIFRGNKNNSGWFVLPSFPEYEIKLDIMTISMRRTRCVYPIPAALSNFNKLKSVELFINRRSRRYSLYIEEYCNKITSWSHLSHKKAQQVLSENLRNVNYIHHLEVSLQYQTRCFRIIPIGSSNQITVGRLTTSCDDWNGQLVYELLHQIEPGHLKCIELEGENICNEVYDMQQVIQADYVRSPHSNVQDCQLMKFCATKLSFGTNTGEEQTTNFEKITASGANQFIKKCLLDLKKRNFDFELVLSYKCEYRQFVSTILEGLDIFSKKTDQEIDEEFYPSEVIVNSNWDDFKLKLSIDNKYLKGKRIEM